MFSGRDQVIPRATLDNAKILYKKAGITKPREEIDCAEIYVPFSWFEPMWMEGMLIAEQNEGWKMTYEGATALDGDFPVNMSGGVLSSNPIGASGLLRFAEAALQVRGRRAQHQVDGARKALGHAYGGGSQYFSTWIVGSGQALGDPRWHSASGTSRSSDPQALALVTPEEQRVSRGELLGGVEPPRARAPRARASRRATRSRSCSRTASPSIELYLACFQAGLYLVPINNHLAGPEIAYIVENSRGEGVRDEPALRARPSRRRCPS